MTVLPPHRVAVLLAGLLLAACGSRRPPPPALLFEGLPVSGGPETARRAGFSWCIEFPDSTRCRRRGVTLGGVGPYDAAVDLRGGGFNQLILWHDTNQHAVYGIGRMLARRGWRSCYTNVGRGGWGDQKIYTRPGAPVKISMDLSYWMKRRLRVIPERGGGKPLC